MPAQATNAHDVDKPLSVLNKNSKRDRLLERLRYIHGEAGRPDVAPGLKRPEPKPVGVMRLLEDALD